MRRASSDPCSPRPPSAPGPADLNFSGSIKNALLQTPQATEVSELQQNNQRARGGLEAKLRRQMAQQICSVQRKETPRISKSGNQHVTLNCVVPVVMNHEDVPLSVNTVKCRHFAHAFTLHRGKKSELMAQFSTAPAIHRKFHARLTQADRDFSAVLNSTTHHQILLENRQLGRYLQSVAMALDSTFPRHTTSHAARAEVNCLLLTDCHAMAVHVERKSKNGVIYFAAKLYEPNTTASYMRVENLNPEGFSHLTVSDMLINKRYKPDSCLGICLDDRLPLRLQENISAASNQAMTVALCYGRSGAVRQMLKAAENEAPEKLASLLTGFNKTTGFSGLGAAFRYGRTETVVLVVEALLRSRLAPHYITNLLTAMSRNGDTGLYTAFKFGTCELVDSVTRCVLASPNIDSKSKVLVLTAWSSSGRCPGLYEAFRSGQTTKVKSFAQNVLASPDLSDDNKVGLLAAKATNGATGLLAARRMGHFQTAQVFVSLVSQSQLSPERKSQLLETSARVQPPAMDRLAAWARMSP